jgi:hypothetical protein
VALSAFLRRLKAPVVTVKLLGNQVVLTVNNSTLSGNSSTAGGAI